MKIDLKKIITNYAGKPFKTEEQTDLTVGYALSVILAMTKEGGHMKLDILARKAYEQEVLEIDGADFTIIKNAVSKYQAYNNIIMAELERTLDASAEKEKSQSVSTPR